MSKQRARKRAEERARRRAPKSASGRGGSASGEPPKPRSGKKPAQRSAREQRRRNRMIAVAAAWLVANALIFVLTDSWSAKWVGLTVTTILVPVVVWLLWDPEGRVDL